MEEQAKQSLPTRTNIYVKNNLIKSSNDSSSSPLTTNSESSDNNETVTLTNAQINSSPRYRPIRRFFTGKSKSAAVSRSASSTSRIMAAEKIYLHNSSEDHSTSETDDLNSDEDDSKLVYKTCLESPPNKSIYLKKSISRPDYVLKNYQYSSSNEKSDNTNHRFIKNNNRLKTSKSMTHCKNMNASFNREDDDLEIDDEDLENDEEIEQQSLYYRQLDGHMKKGKLSRFKVIKSKSNSALQTVRNNFNRQYVHQDDIKQNIANHPIKGNQKDDQITNQLQLNDLAQRLKFIEQKLLQNEKNSEKNPPKINQNLATSSYKSQLNQNINPINQQITYAQQIYKPQNHLNQNYSNHFNQNYSSQYNPNPNQTNHSYQQTNFEQNFQNQIHSTPYNHQRNQDDLCIKNGQFKARIYPSISFGDCSEINALHPKKNKRHFFSSAKSALQNSKSIPSLFIPSSNDKEKGTIDKSSNLPGSNIKTSSSKIWKKPLNMLNNLVDTVDDKILKGRWYSSKSNSTSVRSNSISSTSNLPNKCSADQAKHLNEKAIYTPISKKDSTETKSLSNKLMNSLSNLSSRKNSQNNQSNASSNGDLATRSGSNNSSRFSSTKHLDANQLEIRNQLFPNKNSFKPQKARAHSAPNEELFNLLTLPFIDEDNHIDNSKDNFKNNFKDNVKNNSKDNYKKLIGDKFEYKVKQSKSYKEINSQALREIEAFEQLITDKFNKSNLT